MGVNPVTWFVFAFILEGIIGLFDSCIHGGTKYAEGDYILPNDTIIKTESPRECVQCRCRQGLVLCEIENCPFVDCEAPIQNPHLCCLHCPGTTKEPEKTSDLMIGGTMKKNSDCFSNGKRFRNGSTWQPVIGPFGVMACVECRCRDGVIICSRLQCGVSSCPQPRRQLGHCCPVCPSAAETRRKAICLPKMNEVLVLRTGNVRNNSDRIEYAFLQKEQNNDFLRIHTWNLTPNDPSDVLTFSIVPRRQLRNRNLQLIGSISKRHFRKYSKREKKLRSNCAIKCFAKIQRLESSLVDYSVSEKSKCSEEEIDVADVLDMTEVEVKVQD